MRKLIMICLVLLAINSVAMGETIHITDGVAHTLDDDTYRLDDVQVSNGWEVYNPGTHVNLVDGGSVWNLSAYDNATVTMIGGWVEGYLTAGGDSSIIIFGGSVGHVDILGTATMAEGTIRGNFHTSYPGTGIMVGGSAYNVWAGPSSTIIMAGGSIESELIASYHGIIYLNGTGFEVTVNDVTTSLSYGDKLSDYVTTNGNGTITGTLADFSALDNRFKLYDEGADIIIGDNTTPPPPTHNYTLRSDIDGNAKAILSDLALFADQWLEPICDAANNNCQGANFDGINGVDFGDLMVLIEDWLIDCNLNPADPACIPQ